MPKHWNDKTNESAYLWVLNDAITTQGYSKGALYPENLSNMNLKTKSQRINKMIKLAYYLGQLRGIWIADEFRNVYHLSKKEDANIDEN